MVAVGEDGALSAHELVQTFGDADRHRLQRAGERDRGLGLDEQVDVVVLNRVMTETTAVATAGAIERALDDAEAAPGPKLPDVRLHPQRHMERKATIHLPPSMRDAGIGLGRPPAPRLPFPPGRAEAEVDLWSLGAPHPFTADIIPTSN